MLTKLTIRNFKRFGEVEVELGNRVLFIGPNNSGKTSAMQALALWDIGLRLWNEKWAGKRLPKRRFGVTVNRLDLVSIPVPAANLLWRSLRVRQTHMVDGKPYPNNIRIDLTVEGVTNEQDWKCGLEFEYAAKDYFYCRPLRLSNDMPIERMPVPEREVTGVQQIAFLPPMSGLAATEDRLDPGSIDVRIGEGRTAEVLRNLCYRIHEEDQSSWFKLVEHIKRLFGSELQPPSYIAGRGQIAMTYLEHRVELDLSSAGRGLHQTLLLLAYMYANPGAVLLLDEPDAHLEILRQRQIYSLLTEAARESESQIIAASHSEVLLRQAAQEDEEKIISFVGLKPHRIDDRGDQVLKSLNEIEFDQYYLAEQTGWVLYLEGTTDLSILQAFAERLGHAEASRALERPFVKFVGNQPSFVSNHFHGLLDACPALLGVALFDLFKQGLPNITPVECLMWERREIENYLCTRATLEAYAMTMAFETSSGPLFKESELEKSRALMASEITEKEEAMEILSDKSPWDFDIKVSDEFLKKLFSDYFEKLGRRNTMTKKYFYELVKHIPDSEIDSEIREKLDAIARVAQQAKARMNGGEA